VFTTRGLPAPTEAVACRGRRRGLSVSPAALVSVFTTRGLPAPTEAVRQDTSEDIRVVCSYSIDARGDQAAQNSGVR
jgi:hypothetical protein